MLERAAIRRLAVRGQYELDRQVSGGWGRTLRTGFDEARRLWRRVG